MNNLHFTSCTAVVYYVNPHSLVTLVVEQVLLFAFSPSRYVLFIAKKNGLYNNSISFFEV